MRGAAIAEFVRFDLIVQGRRGSTWLGMALFAALGFAARWLSSDMWRIAGASIPTAPINVTLYMVACTAIAPLLLVQASIASLLGDRRTRATELLSGLPVTLAQYTFARWLSAVLASLLAASAVVVGWLVGQGLDAFTGGRLPGGPGLGQQAGALTAAWGLVIVPNTLFVTTLLFALGARLRSASGAYVGIFCAYALWMLALPASSWAPEGSQDFVEGLLDPFGGRAIALDGHARSVAENDTLPVVLSGTFLCNRLLWLTVTGLLLLWTLRAPALFAASPARVDGTPRRPAVAARRPSLRTTGRSEILKWTAHLRFESWRLVRSSPFAILWLTTILFAFVQLHQGSGPFDTREQLLSSVTLDALSQALRLPMVVVVAILAGELVNRHDDLNMRDLMGAYPLSAWFHASSRLAVLASCIGVFVCGALAVVCAAAWIQDASLRMEAVAEWLLLQMAQGVSLGCLALAFQQVIPARHFASGAFLLLVLGGRAAQALGYASPSGVAWLPGTWSDVGYSELVGFEAVSPRWFALLANAVLLGAALACVALFRRSPDMPANGLGRRRTRIGALAAAAGCLGAGAGWVAMASPDSSCEPAWTAAEQARYELAYKRLFAGQALAVDAVSMQVDFFPAQHSLDARGRYTLRNTGATSTRTLGFTLARGVRTTLSLPKGARSSTDEALGFVTITLAEALEPGARLEVGFESRVVDDPAFVHSNATFVTNVEFLPQLGYVSRRETHDADVRRSLGLAPWHLPEPESADARTVSRLEGGLGWVDADVVVGVPAQDSAFGPGSPSAQWEHAGRKYVRFASSVPRSGLIAMGQAHLRAVTTTVAGVRVALYLDPSRAGRAPEILRAVAASLTEYQAAWGPFPLADLTVAEQASSDGAAHSFQGLVLLPETSELSHEPSPQHALEFLVAHEVAHQWWGNQVLPANARGADMLTETFAQYGALKVLGRLQGPPAVRRLVEQRARVLAADPGAARRAELALAENDPTLVYDVGLVTMDRLARAPGSACLDEALRAFLRSWQYRRGRHPTTADFYDALRLAGSTPVCPEGAVDAAQRALGLQATASSGDAH